MQIMNDIASELARLHTLTGADFILLLKQIAARSEFRLIRGEQGIYAIGGERGSDYNNLLNAARKAVELGYRVFILPNPKGIRTADFIFEHKGSVKMYDLKTIQGRVSVSNRLKESVGQSNRVLLNMRCKYDARSLAVDVVEYFQSNPSAVEVLIFKGKKVMSIGRYQIESPRFYKEFRKRYEK